MTPTAGEMFLAVPPSRWVILAICGVTLMCVVAVVGFAFWIERFTRNYGSVPE